MKKRIAIIGILAVLIGACIVVITQEPAKTTILTFQAPIIEDRTDIDLPDITSTKITYEMVQEAIEAKLLAAQEEEEAAAESETASSSTSSSSSESSSSSGTTTASSSNVATTTTSLPLGQRSRVVVIDAGHGGSDPGCSYGSYVEKNITLQFALAVGTYLQNNGVSVIYTRTGDYELTKDSYTYQGVTYTNDLRARAELGEQYNAALYCSFHIDSSPNAQGFSVFYNPNHQDSLDFANIMVNALASVGYTTNRGTHSGIHLRSIRCNTTIPILVELGFIQSSNDMNYILNNQQTLVTAVGNAIITKLNNGMLEPDKILEKQPNL